MKMKQAWRYPLKFIIKQQAEGRVRSRVRFFITVHFREQYIFIHAELYPFLAPETLA